MMTCGLKPSTDDLRVVDQPSDQKINHTAPISSISETVRRAEGFSLFHISPTPFCDASVPYDRARIDDSIGLFDCFRFDVFRRHLSRLYLSVPCFVFFVARVFFVVVVVVVVVEE